MQGSLVLPHRLSQQFLAVVESAKSLTPELVLAFRVRPLQTYCRCKLVGNSNRQKFPVTEFTKGAKSVNEFCSSSCIEAQVFSSAEDAVARRMRGNSFASFPSCSGSRSIAPSVFHQSVAIHGQTQDYSSWKNLGSELSGPLRSNTGQPWYCIPCRAVRGLKTTHYGPIAGKKARQDLLVRNSDKRSENKSDFYENRSSESLISALSSSDGGSGDVKDKNEKVTVAVSVLDEDSDSENEGEEEEDMKKKHKKGKNLKGMQEEEDSEIDSDDDEGKHKMKKGMSKGKVEVVGMYEDCSDSESDSDEEKEMKKKLIGMREEEDSESDSDDDEEEHKMKKCMSKGKVEVVRMSEACSDSESDSDEEKEMKKKIKADEKEHKKRAKKEKLEMKALKKMECEDSDSEDEDKKKKKREKVLAASGEKALISQYEYLDGPDPSSGNELEAEEDDAIEVVSNALGEEEYEEEDFELVGDEDLKDELESEIEDAFEKYDDEELDDDFWEEEEGEAMVGDGGDGGGVILGDSQWGKKAFELAEVVVKELGTDFAIYAFKSSPDGLLQVRLDKLSDEYGSPTMNELEAFSRKYREILESSGLIPDSVAVEVSSPGAERMVKIPDELERFKQLPMYVQYFENESGNGEKDGVLELDSLDSESGMTVWKLANVKFNREQSGKGRPLNSKQRKWKANVPLNSLKLVRLYLDV